MITLSSSTYPGCSTHLGQLARIALKGQVVIEQNNFGIALCYLYLQSSMHVPMAYLFKVALREGVLQITGVIFTCTCCEVLFTVLREH